MPIRKITPQETIQTALASVADLKNDRQQGNGWSKLVWIIVVTLSGSIINIGKLLLLFRLRVVF